MILFEKIRWKNFLSTGNQFIELDFNAKSTILVSGANGAGKSTVLDALTFVLFSKPYRKINRSQLLNSTNEKDCRVEVEFSIGSTDWKIVRGIKPNVFELKIVENFQLIDNEDFEAFESENTLSILNRYVEESEIDLEKSRIQNMISDVYREACELV